MNLFRQTFLLFVLNVIDAVLTIVWVRSGIATEGNQLMAHLLDIGNVPFLFVKISIGTLAAIVLLYWGDMRIARYGLTISLAIYLGLMCVHLVTGLVAFGYISGSAVHDALHFSERVAAIIL